MWNRNVLFYTEPVNEIWKKASNFIRNDFFQKDFAKVNSLTQDALNDLRQQTSLTSKLAEMNVFKANLIMILFLSNAEFDPIPLKQYTNIFMAEEEINRPYATSRIDM